MRRQVRHLLFLVTLSVVAALGSKHAMAADPSERILFKDAPPAPYHVRFVYAIPADGIDRHLDEDGILARSISKIQAWLVGNTIDAQLKPLNLRLKILMRGSEPEVLFYRMGRTDGELMGRGGRRLTYEIDATAEAADILKSNELYVFFYDGSYDSSGFGACGDATPLTREGQIAKIYLRGHFKNSDRPCSEKKYVGTINDMTGFEFLTLHEIFHLLGAVPDCAPHSGNHDHIVDDPRDVMYSGAGWAPLYLDVRHTEYFGHGRPDCLDVARSPYLTPEVKRQASHPGSQQ